jgi:hypothetical protein
VKNLAKVDGPLLSIGARGKIADVLVFFPWKGRNVVRQWLLPTQPKTTVQGYVRAAVIAIGKEISKIVSVSNGGAVNSKLYSLNTAMAPAGLNWNAFHAQGFLNALQSAGTFKTASFTALVALYSALATGILTAFKTNATALGLSDTAFSYGYSANMEAGLQLYFAAHAVVNNSIQASAPYNTVVASWVASDVDAFKTDHVATD